MRRNVVRARKAQSNTKTDTQGDLLAGKDSSAYHTKAHATRGANLHVSSACHQE